MLLSTITWVDGGMPFIERDAEHLQKTLRAEKLQGSLLLNQAQSQKL